MGNESWDRFWSERTSSEKSEVRRLIWAATWYECETDLELFASFVKTKDEHADGTSAVKPFPRRSDKPYIWEILDIVRVEQLLAIEKSRQLIVTWLMCLYCLWVAKFHDHRLVFVQSKKEEDAANLVYNKDPINARISFMEYMLPEEMQSMDWDRGCSYGQLAWPNGSKIWGIPEGAEKIRSYTASLIFADEFAFQPEAQEAYKAARPTISGGGQFIAVSSANPGAFMRQLIKM